MVRTLMNLHRPGVRIEHKRGNPVTFFQLKDMAELESRKKNAPRTEGERRSSAKSHKRKARAGRSG
jgi:hypothetical protein